MKPGRPFWVMEQQISQINWAPSNPLPATGAVLERLFAETGIPIRYLPDGVRRAKHGDVQLVMNFREEPVTLEGVTLGPTTYRIEPLDGFSI